MVEALTWTEEGAGSTPVIHTITGFRLKVGRLFWEQDIRWFRLPQSRLNPYEVLGSVTASVKSKLPCNSEEEYSPGILIDCNTLSKEQGIGYETAL